MNHSQSLLQKACAAVLGRCQIATVVTQGEQLLLRYFNPAFLELVGGEVDPGFGHRLDEQFPVLCAAAARTLLDRVYSTRQAASIVSQPYSHATRGKLLLTLTAWPYVSPATPALTVMQYQEESERARSDAGPETVLRDLRDVNERLLIASVRERDRVHETAKRLELAEEAAERSERARQISFVQTQSLAQRLITAQETERTRLARELHDDVNQQLAGLAIALSVLRRSLPKGLNAPRDNLDELEKRTAAIIETIREVCHDLHPASLRTAGLLPALRRLCAEVAANTGIRFHANGDFADLPDDASLTLYRVAQEALRNVIRHARARHTDVVLTRDANHIELQIIDDGCGFVNDYEHRGLGLLSMEERVLVVSGDLVIDSFPGSGTRVRVRIPARGIIPREERVSDLDSHAAQHAHAGSE